MFYEKQGFICFQSSFSLYTADICGVLVSWHNIWGIHERVGIFFFVSYDYEPFYICRLNGVFCGNMLLGAFNPLAAFLMTLMINARHLFYGISMLDRFKNTGKKKFYLIFGMCDETFSINCSANIPEDIDKGWFMFFVTLLNHIYWFTGSTLGGILGSLVHFNTKGLDFVMTAMFTVIFTQQWLSEKNHFSSVLGVLVSLLCLVIFSRDNFIVFSMIIILLALSFSKNLQRRNAA